MRSEMENFKNFEIINAEKITPRFLTLARVSKNTESLATIKKDDGSDFESDTDRDRYIRSFYANIYSKKKTDTELSDTCIEDFLGADICRNPVVQQTKLTQEEQVFFEREITLQEYDAAIQNLMSNLLEGGMVLVLNF
jgi:hypothetical protein